VASVNREISAHKELLPSLENRVIYTTTNLAFDNHFVTVVLMGMTALSQEFQTCTSTTKITTFSSIITGSVITANIAKLVNQKIARLTLIEIKKVVGLSQIAQLANLDTHVQLKV